MWRERRGSEDTSPKVGLQLGTLCGGSSAVRFSVFHQLRDTHQIVGQHGSAYQHLESLAAFGAAPLHSPPAKQHGDAAFDADPESLGFLECGAALQIFLLRSLVPTPLRDAHRADLGLPAVLHIVGTVESAISGVALGRVLEDLLMAFQRAFHMVAVGGVALQHLVVGDQALCTLGQEDLVAEFYWLENFAPLDQIRVGFEDRVDFLVAGDLLSLDHPAAGLVDDAVGQIAVGGDLLPQLRDCRRRHRFRQCFPFVGPPGARSALPVW